MDRRGQNGMHAEAMMTGLVIIIVLAAATSSCESKRVAVCQAGKEAIRDALRRFRAAGNSVPPLPLERPASSPFEFLLRQGFLASIPECPSGGAFALEVCQIPAPRPADADLDGWGPACSWHDRPKK